MGKELKKMDAPQNVVFHFIHAISQIKLESRTGQD